jgi:dienelactone hydrolase
MIGSTLRRVQCVALAIPMATAGAAWTADSGRDKSAKSSGDKTDVRVMEGKRAVQVVRSRAAEFKLDPKRVGYIGFSVGSNTARNVVGTSSAGNPPAADPIDRHSSRPDYLALVYGAGRASAGESLKDFPPTFLVSAAADRGPSLANAQLFMDLIRAGVTAEIHVYQKGRHGFGSGFGSPEFSDWMGRLELFLKLDGFLPGENQVRHVALKAAGLCLVAFAVSACPAVVNDGYGDYVYLPAGPFRMGDNFGGGDPRERPVHLVDLDAFYIAKYEMTNGEWKRFRDDPGYEDPKLWPGGRPSYANFVGTQTFDTARPAGFFDGGAHNGFETHKNASPYGAMDMAGNVMEWRSDWYSRDYYSVSPRKNPKGPPSGAYRVLRGGTFFMESFELGYARTAAWPSFQAHRMAGFRPEPAREP